MGHLDHEQMELDRAHLISEYERAKSMLEVFEERGDEEDEASQAAALLSVKASLVAKMHRAADALNRLNNAPGRGA